MELGETKTMKNKTIAAVLAGALALSACSGPISYGPDGAEWEPTVAGASTMEGPASSAGGILVPILAVLLLAVAASHGDS